MTCHLPQSPHSWSVKCSEGHHYRISPRLMKWQYYFPKSILFLEGSIQSSLIYICICILYHVLETSSPRELSSHTYSHPLQRKLLSFCWFPLLFLPSCMLKSVLYIFLNSQWTTLFLAIQFKHVLLSTNQPDNSGIQKNEVFLYWREGIPSFPTDILTSQNSGDSNKWS